jgi:hypothetical protein
VIPIRPSDIDVTRHFWNAFDHCETEISARLICKFMQEHGDEWRPFTLAELSERFKERFCLNRLDRRDILLKDGDVFQVTPKFVGRCYAASPKKEK